MPGGGDDPDRIAVFVEDIEDDGDVEGRFAADFMGNEVEVSQLDAPILAYPNKMNDKPNQLSKHKPNQISHHCSI